MNVSIPNNISCAEILYEERKSNRENVFYWILEINNWLKDYGIIQTKENDTTYACVIKNN